MTLQNAFELVEKQQFNPVTGPKGVTETPAVEERRRPSAPVVFSVAQYADAMPPWGMNYRQRDLALRSFYPTEPYFASALYNMVAKLSAINWHVVNADPTKPVQKNTINAVTKMLNGAGRGMGWTRFWMRVLTDVYTQDNGGFIELIRRDNSPDSAVVMLDHLDAGRCMRTGDPEFPVIYTDRFGREHKMAWYQVLTVEDNPGAVEEAYGLQVCAVSRALRAAQILRDIEIYKHEKVSGRFARAVHFISGVTQDSIEDAMAWNTEQANNQNLYRYMQPMMFSTIDPAASLSHVQIDLASLPDSFDEKETFQQYIAILALAFGVDYQEFAPLPGGQLGSSAQSEVLHLKAQGKGPAALLEIIQTLLNDNVIPANVKFQFQYEDTRSAEARANARYLRGRDRALRLQAGELSQTAALKLAVLDGDLPEYIADEVMASLPVPQAPSPLTPDQIEGGIESETPSDGSTMKELNIDDLRAEAVMRLQRRNELALATGVSLGEEDLRVHQERISRILNAD